MKKSELKTGYLVEARNGKLGIIILDRKVIVATKDDIRLYFWGLLDNWNEELFCVGDTQFDIVRVYDYSYNWTFNCETKSRQLLWERDVRNKSAWDEEVEIMGKKYSLQTIHNALRAYIS